MAIFPAGGGFSRRTFLSRVLPAGAALAAGGGLPPLVGPARAQAPARGGDPVVLRLVETQIAIPGQTGKTFRIEQPDGTWGYAGQRGQLFHAIVENHIAEPAAVHWHGLVVPNDQDGVPYVTQAPIPPGGRHEYRFPLTQSGTYWMRAHDHMQRQRGLAAPLIVRDPDEVGGAGSEVVLFLTDWTFRDPRELWADLRKYLQPDGGVGRLRMVGGPPPGARSGKASSGARGARGADFDAFLANGRTLADPQVIRVDPGQTMRLRVINAAAATNFFLMLGALTGQAVAVDGQPIAPLASHEFELAMGARIDVRVTLPAGQGAYPIFAQGEGTNRRAGVVLATPRAAIPRLGEAGPVKIDELGFGQELRLRAAVPLARRPVDRSLTVEFEGSAADNVWKLNGEVWPDCTPLPVGEGERVEILFRNRSGMDYPMHLHGHTFQVTEVGMSPIAGARRDTFLINARQSARIQFDADNPGVWLLHGLVMYHDRGGVMTTLNYEGVPVPDFGPRQ